MQLVEGLSDRERKQSKPASSGVLNLLALASAELGKYQKAVEYQSQVIDLADENAREDMKEMLSSFRENKPYRIKFRIQK